MFGPQYLLHDGGERAFFLSGLPATGVPAWIPRELSVRKSVPRCPDATPVKCVEPVDGNRNVASGADSSTARGPRGTGKQRVSALWLWGRAVNVRLPVDASEPCQGGRGVLTEGIRSDRRTQPISRRPREWRTKTAGRLRS